MLGNLIPVPRIFKWRFKPSRRALVRQIGELKAANAEIDRIAGAFQRRARELTEENLALAGYIRFLTDKCIKFDIDKIVREAEKGMVTK